MYVNSTINGIKFTSYFYKFNITKKITTKNKNMFKSDLILFI